MTIVIEPKSGVAFRVDKGTIIRVSDAEGKQCADLVAYNSRNKDELLSQGFTRLHNNKTTLNIGDHLYSNLDTPMLTIVEDKVGVHDLLYPPCNKYYYKSFHNIPGKTGCRDHLADALKEYGITYREVTDPFNIFMNTKVNGKGELEIHTPLSEAGDYIDIRAEMDLIVGISACADDIEGNNKCCTGINVTLDVK